MTDNGWGLEGGTDTLAGRNLVTLSAEAWSDLP